MNNFIFHNIRNQLFLITLLLKKIKSEDVLIEKIRNIIDSINIDCLQSSDHEIDGLVDLNITIDELTSIYPDIVFEKEFHGHFEFIENKSDLRDVLINIIKNSQEANAQIVKLKILDRKLIITDDGECTKVVIDKLNKSNIFTTKRNGCGIGSQTLRQFCIKQGCHLTYSLSTCDIQKKKSSSMVIAIVFP